METYRITARQLRLVLPPVVVTCDFLMLAVYAAVVPGGCSLVLAMAYCTSVSSGELLAALSIAVATAAVTSVAAATPIMRRALSVVSVLP